MKPRISESMQRQAETKCLQEELVAAVHGAFQVAVEIAVQEVSKLVLQITEDMCEEMRRENQTLKQRLQEAEALLDSNQLLRAPKDQPTCSKYNLKNPDAAASCGVRGDNRADHQDPDPPKHDPMSRGEGQRAGAGVRVQDVSDAEKVNGCADVCEAVTAEVRAEMSRLCAARQDSFNSTSLDLEDQDHSSAPRHRADMKSTLEQVRVKQETPEEETDGSDCFLDSFKVEDFSSECMSEVQSKMLEEWKPEVLDNQNLDPDSGPAQAASNLTSHLPPPSEPPSLSSELPNVLQLVEPAPVLEPPSQVYGVRVRTHRSPANLYACKSCGQMFHQPSLLRRHYGQCPLRLQQQQCFQQPVLGGKRTRLQLYPPGCSPFRCTVCNREFNRMENLKTHLRIHTGERPYTCSVCSKCFRHSGALTRHFRIHTGEKPYVCGQCGKSFRNPGGLKFHQRCHTK